MIPIDIDHITDLFYVCAFFVGGLVLAIVYTSNPAIVISLKCLYS